MGLIPIDPLFSPPAHFVALQRCSDAAQTKQLCDVMGRTISHRWPSPQLQSARASRSRYSGSGGRARWKTLLDTSTSCAWTERLKKSRQTGSAHRVHDVEVEKLTAVGERKQREHLPRCCEMCVCAVKKKKKRSCGQSCIVAGQCSRPSRGAGRLSC